MSGRLRAAACAYCTFVCALFATLFAPVGIGAQTTAEFRTATLFESYSFDRAIGGEFGAADEISELSVPITATVRWGRRIALVLSSGFATVETRNSGATVGSVSGLVDTEARVTYQLLPDRLTAFATSSFPTGVTGLERDEFGALSLLATDVIGFSSPTLGRGGAAGGGLAYSMAVGRTMALGAAATFERHGAYQPVSAETGAAPISFRPGEEVRVRVGLEGATGLRTFVRISAIYSRRGDDVAGGVPVQSVGNQFTGYVSVDQGVGVGTVSVYLFDLFRSSAGSSLEAVPMPRGNVLAGGVQLAWPVRVGTTVIPRLEVRDSRLEIAEGGGLESAGRTIRFGVDVRQRVNQNLALVVRGGGLSGDVSDYLDRDSLVGVSGFRLSAVLQIVP